ncbi:type II secretion system protein [Exiguobacterium oxidotolerans]|uniref:type II secretion system protein n=1 Tax=Exiguobacterium oxidotolerans TaxID=223958 RepID=UPI000494C6A9|nr:type II secretion system protein [Exiguobacterium oxidotolerans]
MRKSEQGYTLLFVLVTLTVLSVLAVATIGISLQSTRLTEIRETDIDVETTTQNDLDLAVAALQKIVSKTTGDSPTTSSQEIFKNLNSTVILPLKSIVPNVTVTPNKAASNVRVTALDLTAVVTKQKGNQPAIKKSYRQRVYLSAIPSFLYYTLGSDNKVILNGAPLIEGNIFSRKALQATATPIFKYNNVDGKYTNTKALPYVAGQVRVFQEKNQPLLQCGDYLVCDKTIFDPKGETELVATKETLVPFDFEYALNDFLKLPTNTPSDQIVSSLKDSSIPQFTLDGPFLTELDTKRQMISPALNTDNTVTLTDDLVQETLAPLIIDGNLTISSLNPISQPLEIKRPLVVLGNLLIRGNVGFATTIYATGTSSLDDANIQGLVSTSKQNTLILLSKGKLVINRVNKFSTPQTDIPDLNAFLYSDYNQPTTDDNFPLNTIYAVGSTMNVRGGIFTKGNLEVNAYRGKLDLPENAFPANVTELEKLMVANKSSDIEASRLRMAYDATVLKNPTALLPLNRAVQLYVETPKRVQP